MRHTSHTWVPLPHTWISSDVGAAAATRAAIVSTAENPPDPGLDPRTSAAAMGDPMIACPSPDVIPAPASAPAPVGDMTPVGITPPGLPMAPPVLMVLPSPVAIRGRVLLPRLSWSRGVTPEFTPCVSPPIPPAAPPWDPLRPRLLAPPVLPAIPPPLLSPEGPRAPAAAADREAPAYKSGKLSRQK
jgi:hypothetical protein